MLLAGCQWFGVNICFSDEDRILIENLYVFKGHRAKTSVILQLRLTYSERYLVVGLVALVGLVGLEGLGRVSVSVRVSVK